MTIFAGGMEASAGFLNVRCRLISRLSAASGRYVGMVEDVYPERSRHSQMFITAADALAVYPVRQC